MPIIIALLVIIVIVLCPQLLEIIVILAAVAIPIFLLVCFLYLGAQGFKDFFKKL